MMGDYNDDIYYGEKQANSKQIESDAVLFTSKGKSEKH